MDDGAITCERGALQPFSRDQSSAGLRSLGSATQHPPSPNGISGQIICKPSRESTIQLILNVTTKCSHKCRYCKIYSRATKSKISLLSLQIKANKKALHYTQNNKTICAKRRSNHFARIESIAFFRMPYPSYFG